MTVKYVGSQAPPTPSSLFLTGFLQPFLSLFRQRQPLMSTSNKNATECWEFARARRTGKVTKTHSRHFQYCWRDLVSSESLVMSPGAEMAGNCLDAMDDFVGGFFLPRTLRVTVPVA